MRCPVCGGNDLYPTGPGWFRCDSRVIVGGVPTGMAGNYTGVTAPIYGECGATFDHESARMAAVPRMAPDPAAEAERKQQEEERLAKRKSALLRALIAHGCPGIQRRFQVVGERRKRFLRSEELVLERSEVPSSWPIGKLVLRSPVERREHGAPPAFNTKQVEAGITAEGEVVPMDLTEYGTGPGSELAAPEDVVVKRLTELARRHGVDVPE